MADLFYGKGITVASGFDLGAKAPLDHRIVVDTIADRDAHVTGNRAYEGMIVFVKEDQTTYQLVMQTPKEGEPTLGWKVFGADAVDLSEYAKMDYVDQQIANAVTGGKLDLSAYAKVADMNTELAKKVDKVDGKSLIDDAEIARLAQVDNYNDTEVRGLIAGKADAGHVHSYNDLTDKPVIPSIEGLATETYVDGKVSDLVNGAPEAMDTLKELSDAIKAHQSVYDAYVQTVSDNLAKKVDKEEGKSLVADTDIAKIHEHANKEELDKIQVGDKAKWDAKADANHNHDDVYLKEVPAEYITETELAAKGFLKEHQDISHLAIKTDVDTALAAKAPLEHTHDFADLENAPDMALYAKVADEEAREVFTTEILTVNSLGGIAAGADLNGMTVREILAKLLYPYVAPTITATGTPNGGVFEKGDDKEITNVRAVVTKKSEAITKVEVFNGSVSLGIKEGDEVKAGGTFNFPVTVSVPSTNVVLTAKVTDAANKTYTANTGAFNFVYPYYVGIVAEDAVIDEALVKGLTKKIEAKGNKTIAYTCDNQKMVFAYPKAYGNLKSVIDPNNFDVTGTFTKQEVSITGLDGSAQAYYVYVNGASTVNDFNMKFNY